MQFIKSPAYPVFMTEMATSGRLLPTKRYRKLALSRTYAYHIRRDGSGGEAMPAEL